MLLTLIGYRGTGKTTIARCLAQSWSCPWWDADQQIQQSAGCTIAEIFAERGEEAFRDLEQRAIAELSRQPQGILAVGGGAVLRETNRRAMAAGKVVWLTARPATIWERISADPTTASSRPQLTQHAGLAEIESLLAAREPLYREAADYCVDTESRTPEEVAAEITHWWGT